MEPDKFEKHIKSKLAEREIMPSEDAWKKISSQLNTHTKKPDQNYFWYGVAASVMVIIALSIFYMNSDRVVNLETDIIVETPAEIVPKESTGKDLKLLQKADSNAVVMEQKIEKEVQRVEKETTTKNSFLAESQKQEVTVASRKEEISDNLQTTVVLESVINIKVAEVVAQVNALELSSEVTDAEVDSLLLNAQQDILREKLFNPDKTVDAMALLTQVEDELDQSFRDQIFQSLKAGFLKVRTAVADRNN